MYKKLFLSLTITLSLSAVAMAQGNANKTQTTTTTTQQRTTTTKAATTAAPAAATPASAQRESSTPAPATPARRAAAATGANAARAVRDAFDTLISGIRRGDADEVMGVYWNSPRLVLYNNNGTVTKTWEQVKSNRQSSYAKVKDVKLDLSDDRVMMLGREAAMVTARWKQSQMYDGKPESASGRMTVVFQSVGGQWKAVHVHTSPDRPDPSLLLPSERTTMTNDPAEPAGTPGKP